MNGNLPFTVEILLPYSKYLGNSMLFDWGRCSDFLRSKVRCLF